jgi:hypothetical protein
VYDIVVLEYETGVNTPDELIVAAAGLELLQVPAGVASESVIGLPQ